MNGKVKNANSSILADQANKSDDFLQQIILQIRYFIAHECLIWLVLY